MLGYHTLLNEKVGSLVRGGGVVPRKAHNLQAPVQFRPPQQVKEKTPKGVFSFTGTTEEGILPHVYRPTVLVQFLFLRKQYTLSIFYLPFASSGSQNIRQGLADVLGHIFTPQQVKEKTPKGVFSYIAFISSNTAV